MTCTNRFRVQYPHHLPEQGFEQERLHSRDPLDVQRLWDTSQINQAIGRPVERFSTLSELISGGTLQEQHTQKDLA